MILVTDDDPGVVQMLSTLLEKEGHTVQTAANGGEAYERVKSGDCKLLLLDIRMPHINGIELLLLMQAENIKVPTIVMAGFDDFDEAEMREFANVVAYLHKPFQNSDLLDAVRKYALN